MKSVIRRQLLWSAVLLGAAFACAVIAQSWRAQASTLRSALAFNRWRVQMSSMASQAVAGTACEAMLLLADSHLPECLVTM